MDAKMTTIRIWSRWLSGVPYNARNAHYKLVVVIRLKMVGGQQNSVFSSDGGLMIRKLEGAEISACGRVWSDSFQVLAARGPFDTRLRLGWMLVGGGDDRVSRTSKAVGADQVEPGIPGSTWSLQRRNRT